MAGCDYMIPEATYNVQRPGYHFTGECNDMSWDRFDTRNQPWDYYEVDNSSWDFSQQHFQVQQREESQSNLEKAFLNFMRTDSEELKQLKELLDSQHVLLESQKESLKRLGRTMNCLLQQIEEQDLGEISQHYLQVNSLSTGSDEFVSTGYPDYTPFRTENPCVPEVKKVENTESPNWYDDDDVIRVRDELYSGSKLERFRSPVHILPPAQPEEQVCNALNVSDDFCVNVPLVDVIADMPRFGKFLNGLMAKKGNSGKASAAFLEAECDVILKKRAMPPKLGDPGPFILPCKLDGSDNFQALADSGACINVMPYSLYTRLKLGDLTPSQKAVRSFNKVVSSPVGIVEDVVVKVGELEFLADFVVVDIEEDDVPLILGRPFLATAGALFDIRAGKLTLRDRGKSLSFQTRHFSTPPPTSNVVSVSTPKKVTPNKCGEVKTGQGGKPPDDGILDRSMRKLYSRVHGVMGKKDEHLRTRLVSNLSKSEKDKLFELIVESRAADDWMLSSFGYDVDKGGGSYGSLNGGAHRPGIS